MNHENKIKHLFEEIVERSPEERQRYLDEHCDHAGIRAEVELLLSHHDESTGFLPAGGFSMATTEDSLPAHLTPARALSGIFGHYEIQGVLGRGGMGVVYLAHDQRLDRPVALKTLHGDGGDPAGLARFQAEAKVLARLTHPTIVPIYEAGEIEGQEFLAMQYIEGSTLDKIIATRREEASKAPGSRQGPQLTLHQRELARLIARLADGLDHAHRLGIVHRDVKPANIIVDNEGEPHLTDFGIAKVLGAAAITRAGEVAGSCRYLSPEQARADAEQIDARSDVFSLGVVLYEALALVVPFNGQTMAEVLLAVVSREPKKLRSVTPQIPKDLETICHKALEKKPVDRYQSAAHMAADLRTFLSGGPILARPPSLLRRGTQILHRHRLASVSIGLVLVLAALAASLWIDAQRHWKERFRVDVSTRSGSAQIYLSHFDPALGAYGPPTDQGPTPTELSLLPGLYALTGVSETGEFAETTVFSTRTQVQLDVVLKLLAPDAVEGLIPIPAGAHRLGNPSNPAARSAPRTVALPKYYIAQTEVSNAEYATYVAATGAKPPSGWPKPYDRSLDNLPVVGINRGEAAAYARWLGLRLPTADEHEAAARWPDGGLARWATGPRPPGLPNYPHPTPRNIAALRAAYLEQVADVRSHPEAATSTGLYHMNSNVSEWTSDVDFSAIQAPIYRGGNWTRDSEEWDLSQYATNPPEKHSLLIGFRCARSAAHSISERP